MISQITADGSSPAIRARSTEASVCPARFRTPPDCARSGNMCPGRSRSAGRVLGSMAASTVLARSAAEMPVVVRPRASIETVNAVPKLEVFCSTMGGSSRASQRSPVRARQTRPRPSRAMKLIASGVTFSAARTRSPSFSRSSSSTTTTRRPAWSSSTALSIEANGDGVLIPANSLTGKLRAQGGRGWRDFPAPVAWRPARSWWLCARGPLRRKRRDPSRSTSMRARHRRRIFHARLVIPAAPGPLKLTTPSGFRASTDRPAPWPTWPGSNVTAAGKTIPWRRDAVGCGRFPWTVPAGADAVEVALDYLSPAETSGFSSGASATAQLAVVSWNTVLLYPPVASTDAIQFRASLQLPEGWKFGNGAASRVGSAGSRIEFRARLADDARRFAGAGGAHLQDRRPDGTGRSRIASRSRPTARRPSK